MAGTVIITGANGSLASSVLDYPLVASNRYFQALVLTVRNISDADGNTKKLRKKISKYPGVNVSIRELDLAKLSAVHEFATTVAAEIKDGKLPPLSSIVCIAHHWNLVSGVETTEDGYETTFQVNHLAHTALILRLLGSFGPSGGRVAVFSSDAHCPGMHMFEKYRPVIPVDLQLLVKPVAEKPSDNFFRGVQREALSKLAAVMWMYRLNHYLEKACPSASPRSVSTKLTANVELEGSQAEQHHSRCHRSCLSARLPRSTNQRPLHARLRVQIYLPEVMASGSIHGYCNAQCGRCWLGRCPHRDEHFSSRETRLLYPS